MFPRIDKGPVEYRLRIARAWNTEQQRECVRFSFRTEEEFHHFRYGISTEHTVKDGHITVHLRGLKTSALQMPGTGNAEADVDLFDLRGSYRVTVYKPGNVHAAFGLQVGPARLRLERSTPDGDAFLHISTD
jgi:hypothetical protein